MINFLGERDAIFQGTGLAESGSQDKLPNRWRSELEGKLVKHTLAFYVDQLTLFKDDPYYNIPISECDPASYPSLVALLEILAEWLKQSIQFLSKTDFPVVDTTGNYPVQTHVSCLIEDMGSETLTHFSEDARVAFELSQVLIKLHQLHQGK